MQIRSYQLKNQLIVAPMAGISDHPFRNLCIRYGAALAVSEMISSNPRVWDSDKSRRRRVHTKDDGIRAVQIVGTEPDVMANAAVVNVQQGAQIIDINMGCPAKKVDKKRAGAALLEHPKQVKEILQAVVGAVNVPVTLKIRTGVTPEQVNAVQIAQIAQDCGIASLAVHGRTRQCMFKGAAEYDTIKLIKQRVSIPIVANGDICTPEKARFVLDYTGADALMIGRGAQGRPWIFKEIEYYLATGNKLVAIDLEEKRRVILEHLTNMHILYGDYQGVRIARKHIGWYLNQPNQQSFRVDFNRQQTKEQQCSMLEHYFDELINT